MNDEFDYVLYSDASHYRGKSWCGWAFALLIGDEVAYQVSGRIETENVMDAEIHAITKGLAARPNLTSTLVLTDIAVNDAVRLIPESSRVNTHIRSLSAKGRHRWHIDCHKRARVQAR